MLAAGRDFRVHGEQCLDLGLAGEVFDRIVPCRRPESRTPRNTVANGVPVLQPMRISGAAAEMRAICPAMLTSPPLKCSRSTAVGCGTRNESAASSRKHTIAICVSANELGVWPVLVIHGLEP